MSTMMSLLKKKPRHEVISIRLSEDRLKLLERYKKVLSEQRGREVSLGEAAFLVIEERVDGMDRETARHEMLSAPTSSLYRIRKKWESQHTLSGAEWDVLTHYVQIATEEERQEPPLLWPAIPSRESYLALLDAFEAVYLNRKNPASKHAWYYFRNLGGQSIDSKASLDKDGEKVHQAVRKQISTRRELLKPAEKWQSPGAVGACLLIAGRDEGVDSTRLDQVLGPYWPTLWGLAARGHWVKHDRQPVRPAGPNEDDFRRRIIPPDAVKLEDLKLSFTSIGCPELGMYIDFGPTRRFNYLMARYPALTEFRALLEGWPAKHSWSGRHFLMTVSKERGGTKFSLGLRLFVVDADFTESEWDGLRELFQRALAIPEIQRWLEELRLEYGEQG